MSKDDSLFLKGIAILLLLFHHNPFDSVFGEVLQSGARVCVWIFAFISAYGFTLQVRDRYEKKPFHFIFKRVVLLYSLMWFFYLFNLITEIILNPHGIIGYFKLSVFNLPLDMLNIPSLFGKLEVGSYWYVNFLLVVIVLFPLLYFLAKKLSWFSVPLVMAVLTISPYKFPFIHGGNLTYYILIVMLGILFAQKDVFGALSKIKGKKTWLVLIAGLATLVPLLILRNMFLPEVYDKWYWGLGPFSAAITIVIVLMVFLCRTDNKVTKLIQTLGKYSGNMYFSQGFFYNILVFTLPFQNEFVSFITCFIYSLAISILVEIVKKNTNYNENVRKLIKKTLKEA